MARKNSKQSPVKEPQWRYVERIAALLESALAPEARVQHSVFLPVLGRPDREPRQCDVVVTYGKPPRELIAIVEVQKRNEKPDINTFNGWVEKMREVGAQLLMCVSARGYPASIRDKVANQLGPTVRLLTLSQLESARLPGITLAPFVLHQHPHVTIRAVGQVRLRPRPGVSSVQVAPGVSSVQVGADEKRFRRSDVGGRLSLNEVLARVLEAKEQQDPLRQAMPEPEQYSLEVELGSPHGELWMEVENEWYQVIQLPATVEIETKSTRVPLEVLSYQQEFVNGTLAWVASARGEVPEKQIELQLVFTRTRDGLLQLTHVRQQGAERLTLLVSPDPNLLGAIVNHTFEGDPEPTRSKDPTADQHPPDSTAPSGRRL